MIKSIIEVPLVFLIGVGLMFVMLFLGTQMMLLPSTILALLGIIGKSIFSYITFKAYCGLLLISAVVYSLVSTTVFAFEDK